MPSQPSPFRRGGPSEPEQTVSITVTAPVTFNKWQAPNFAVPFRQPGLRQDGMKFTDGVSVRDLPEQALNALVEAWLHDLYEKAGKPIPTLRFA